MNVEAIILSKSSDISRYGLTCRTINSLKNSNEWDGNVIVVESEDKTKFLQNGFLYPMCNVVFPGVPFNYNKFLNIGISHLKDETEWILICNNDLFFTPSWLTVMKDIMESRPDILSFSPISPTWHLHEYIKTTDIIEGYRVSLCVCGWCILMHRSLIDKCDLFDEQFEFWYQDNDYSCSLELHKVKHAMVPTSKVYHLDSSSHDLLEGRKKEMTYDQVSKFFNKWNRYA